MAIVGICLPLRYMPNGMVSCPGVWLCQDGLVSLTIYALGSSFQTSSVPPHFPLLFDDVFYFRKQFQETCALNNICCILKDETVYCELVQWSTDCAIEECETLAQYLGALNDILFPPTVCSSDGVDLLMRRSKHFPGILSPKIEIATKVRIDELWNQNLKQSASPKTHLCECQPHSTDAARQKPVCHTSHYHRYKCTAHRRPNSSQHTRSSASKSCDRLETKQIKDKRDCCQNSTIEGRKEQNRCALGENQNVTSNKNYILDSYFLKDCCRDEHITEYKCRSEETLVHLMPCVCNICRRYYDYFYTQ